MFKNLKALGIVGLATISASQLALAQPNNVLWSPNKENGEVLMAKIHTASRAFAQPGLQRPLVRFTRHDAGGYAVVPLLPADADGRCSPDFDAAPFQAAKGGEIWANFEFVNIDPNDRELLTFAIKADKPGRKDRLRVNHDIGLGRLGNNTALSAMLTPPSADDYGYYFADRSLLSSEELLERNPDAAIKITISNHTPGPVA